MWRPVSVANQEMVGQTIEAPYRTFPCPECAPAEPIEKVGFIQVQIVMQQSLRWDQPLAMADELVSDTKRAIAAKIIDRCLRDGLIEFEIGKITDTYSTKFAVRGTLAIVGRRDLHGMLMYGKRAVQDALAAFRNRVIDGCRVFSSNLTIHKDDAERIVMRSERELLDEWQRYEDKNTKKGAR